MPWWNTEERGSDEATYPSQSLKQQAQLNIHDVEIETDAVSKITTWSLAKNGEPENWQECEYPDSTALPECSEEQRTLPSFFFEDFVSAPSIRSTGGVFEGLGKTGWEIYGDFTEETY